MLDSRTCTWWNVALLLVCLVGGVFGAEAAGQEDDPLAADSKAGDGQTDGKDEGDSADRLRIPLGRKSKATFGAAGCPVVVVGTGVWQVKTGRRVQELEGEYEWRGMTALSNDQLALPVVVD